MKLNKSLKVLFFLNSIFVFAGALLGPLYAVYVQQIDHKIVIISISWAAYMLSTTLFTYLISRVGDKVKEKEYLLALGFLVRSLAWFGYLFVANVQMLIFIQILLGIGDALGTPAWGSIFADHLNVRREIMEYSAWSVISNIMIALGTVVGGVLVSFYGFKILFLIMGFLALISFIGTLITPRKVL